MHSHIPLALYYRRAIQGLKDLLFSNIVGCLLFQNDPFASLFEKTIRINNNNKRILDYEVISRDSWRDWWTYLQANSKLHELKIRWQGTGY